MARRLPHRRNRPALSPTSKKTPKKIRPPVVLRRSLVAVCIQAALSPQVVSAQETSQDSQIEVVTVTAQKRKEDPAKVAMSISAVSGTQLQSQHVNDITDLTRIVPNISFTAATGNGGAGPGTSNIEVRGISSGAGAATVGIYLGDVSLTVGNVYTMGAVEPKFFDIDRVEVLRGPQGTLFGKNTTAGAISGKRGMATAKVEPSALTI